MKKFWMLTALAVLSVALITGCGSAEKETETAEAESAAETAADPHAGHDHGSDDGEKAEMASSVEGTLGCGHCNYSVADHCCPAVKTASGDVFIVDAEGEAGEQLMAARLDQPKVSITGSVEMQNGLKIIHVDTYQMN
jgi:hypothetical protein